MPGDDMVRTRYAAGLSALEADYDRWLAEHDRRLAARVLRAAADYLDADKGGNSAGYKLRVRAHRVEFGEVSP